MKERRPDRCRSFHSFIVITLSEITFYLPSFPEILDWGRVVVRSSYTLYLLPELSCVSTKFREISSNTSSHPLFSAGVGTVSSSRCTAPGCSRATPWTPTSAPRRRVKVGGKIICTLPKKYLHANIEPFWHPYINILIHHSLHSLASCGYLLISHSKKTEPILFKLIPMKVEPT